MTDKKPLVDPLIQKEREDIFFRLRRYSAISKLGDSDIKKIIAAIFDSPWSAELNSYQQKLVSRDWDRK